MQDEEVKVNNEAVAEAKDSDSKVYEIGYLLVPTIKEEDIPVVYGNLKELVSSHGGEVIMDEMPKMINLAYPMQKIVSNVRNKFTTAYFGWTKFVMDPVQILEVKKILDLDPNFIRFLVLKTVRENTIAAKRFVRGETYKRPTAKKPTDTDVPAAPINKEEIDKEIDAMVAI